MDIEGLYNTIKQIEIIDILEYSKKYNIKLILFYGYSFTVVPIFPHYSPLPHPTPVPTVNSHHVVHVMGHFTFSLFRPFHPYSPSHLAPVSVFLVYMPLVLFGVTYR